MADRVKVTLVKSPIGAIPKGMTDQVRHLVKVEEI